MIDPRLLETATARGLVTPDQAQALGALASELAAADREPVDRERLRFVTGFSDVFVTLGIVLVYGSVQTLVTSLGVGAGVTAFVTAIVLLGLAEIFTRRRRQALPSILLLVLFALSVFTATASALGLAIGPEPLGGWRPFLGFEGASPFGFGFAAGRSPLVTAGAAALTAGAIVLHYRRFGVPITVAVGVASLCILAVALLEALAPAFVEAALTWILLCLGLVVFALAMRFDLSDPERVTRRTDVAFWLHLLAAPLIVHSLVGPLMEGAAFSIDAALVAMALFLALAAVALVVDRRALLVSGLAYVGIAFATLVQGAGFTGDVLPLTLLVLGTLVLLLSIGWVPLRGALLRALPAGFARRLPRPVG